MSIEILLATYNGAEHLPELFSSLEGQTRQDWQLLVRDDGSSDATPQLLQGFQAKHPLQVKILTGGSAAQGAKDNFATLLSAATADYLLFADQDDVWLPNKIAHLLQAAQRLGDTQPARPLLVHSDLQVVDERLQRLSPSFWAYQGISATDGQRFPRLLAENCVTGCAMLINRPLRDLALPMPEQAIMHDWWLALVASAFGHIEALAEPTVLYRQHPQNTVGAKRWHAGQLLRQFCQNGLAPARRSIARKRAQAASFAQQFSERYPGHPAVATARHFASLQSRPWGWRHYLAWRSGYGMARLARRIGFYLAL